MESRGSSTEVCSFPAFHYKSAPDEKIGIAGFSFQSGLGGHNCGDIYGKITKRSYETKTPILQLATDESSGWDDCSKSSIGKDDINPVVTLRGNLFYKNQYELQFF